MPLPTCSRRRIFCSPILALSPSRHSLQAHLICAAASCIQTALYCKAFRVGAMFQEQHSLACALTQTQQHYEYYETKDLGDLQPSILEARYVRLLVVCRTNIHAYANVHSPSYNVG